MVKLKDYEIVDLILGKQKESTVGAANIGYHFKSIPEKLQKALRTYVNKGGDLLVSGQYVASDLTGDRSSQADKDFAVQVLGINPGEPEKVRNPRIQMSPESGAHPRGFTYNNTLNERTYIVENPDMLVPIGDAVLYMDFDDNGQGAAVARSEGNSRTITMSIPFESINNAQDRIALLKNILTYFKQ